MNWIVGNIRWIMLASGALTCTMLYAAFAPEAALRSTFGESLEGPVAGIVVRNWSVLIGVMGAMLIYGSNRPLERPLILTVAGASKLVFVALVLSQGQRFLGYQAGVAVAVDSAVVALFAVYLAKTRRPAPAPAR
jgi:hypothetical protein